MRNLARLFSLSLAVLPLLSSAALAEPENKTAQLNVSLEIEQGCTLKFGAEGELSFGTFINLKNPRQEQGSFSLSCSKSGGSDVHLARISLDGGLDSNDKPSNRVLYLGGVPSSDPKKRMRFQVYQGRSGRIVWGNGADGATYDVTIPAGSTAAVNVPFYAELFAQSLEGFAAGTYSNVLHVIVNYQ